MLLTTLSTKLLDEYGRDTVVTWSKYTRHKIVVVVSPDEVEAFKAALGPDYTVLAFSAVRMQYMAAIRACEQALDHRRGDYRWAASRFAWKVFAMDEVFNAFPQEPSITWIDADSVLKDGFDEWLAQLFSPQHAVSFLGRAHKQLHSESGLINFIGTEGRKQFERVLALYTSLDLFEYNEWHDGYLFNTVFQFSKHCFDICKHRGVRSSNPLYELDRGRHMVHLKGMRKNSSRFSYLLDDLRILLRR